MNATDNARTELSADVAWAELCEILQASLMALADAGEGDAACRLAGRACAALRGQDPVQWTRFNKVLHRLSPRTGPVASLPPAR